MDSLEISRQLQAWFDTTGRAALEKLSPERVPQFADDLVRLKGFREAAWPQLNICFLGLSGVGKSSLLNALVARERLVLPQGGVGPLTAQATVVRHAERPYLRVSYLGRDRLHRLAFALEQHHEAELRRAGKAIDANKDLEQGLTEEDRAEAESSLPVEEAAGATGTRAPDSDKIEAYKRQARLMVQGNQFAVEGTLEYLLDGLRSALGREPRWGTALGPADRDRVSKIRELLGRKGPQTAEFHADSDPKAFQMILREHASGFLAPLIKTLELGWNSDSLKNGLVLVDLPGLGVANDEYRQVTSQYVRSARAVVMVVDRAGVSEASADLLRTTGFFNALLHDGHDPEAEPTHLIVAVVKLDLSATDAWQDERQTNPEAARKWSVHFEEASQRSIDMVRSQVHAELEKLVASGPEATRDDRRESVQRVLSTLQVIPVSSLEYRKWYLQDEDDKPRITDPAQSRVPQFAEALAQISRDHSARVHARLDDALTKSSQRILSAFEVLRVQWEEDKRAKEEVDKLRAELETFLEPRRKEFASRQGAFREFLRYSIPLKIEGGVTAAASEARKDIKRYLNRLKDCHWATLRAAVRRGGTYVGSRHVDVPNELTLRFEEPVAIVWTKDILSALRQRTNELGKDYVSMVAEVLEWAKEQGARVQPRLVEALRDELMAENKELATIGKEAISELKEKVKQELGDKIQDRVRRRCKKFVDEHQDEGVGVKQRIIELLGEDLLDGVIEAAKPASTKVLTDNYREVEQEISRRFRKYENPLDTAAQSLLSSHEDRIRRSDAKRRVEAIALIEQATAGLPMDLRTQAAKAKESA